MQLQFGVFLLFLSAALAQNFTHADVTAAVDRMFRGVDANRDGQLQTYELLGVYDHIDTNHDHRVGQAEFSARATHHMFLDILFMELDYDGDGYLDRSAELGQFIVMDKNSDNEVSRREYDTYYTDIVYSAIKHFGHFLGNGQI